MPFGDMSHCANKYLRRFLTLAISGDSILTYLHEKNNQQAFINFSKQRSIMIELLQRVFVAKGIRKSIILKRSWNLQESLELVKDIIQTSEPPRQNFASEFRMHFPEEKKKWWIAYLKDRLEFTPSRFTTI